MAIFYRHGYVDPSERELGDHHRVAFFEGDADWKELISTQVFTQQHALLDHAASPGTTFSANKVGINARQNLPRTLVAGQSEITHEGNI